MKSVLVTGGAGYVGSHACKALAAAGYQPVTFDNLVYGHRQAVRWGPLIHGDILDRAAVDKSLRTWNPVAVMHFAAFAFVGESVTHPGKYYRNNVAGSLSLLEALRDHGVSNFIFSSTCATYGLPQAMCIREDHPQNPINPYGASKLMIERMLQDFDSAHGLRSISLRYFNAAGADPAGEIGEAHDPETHLIPLVLDAAHGVRPDITIFGDQYATPDGTCIRDYVHVADLAQAHVLALQALESGAPSTAYNLGNGRGFSVRQVIEVAESVTGRAVPVRVGSQRAGDPPQLVGDATRIRAALGWQPCHAELEDIIGTAWRWHQRAQDRSPDGAWQ
jgi:UDP-glucose-4-epimerase GalE